MERDAVLFRRRPMCEAALGLCAGILLSKSVKGTWFYLAVCLFGAFIFLTFLPRPRELLSESQRRGGRVFLSFLLFGLTRALCFPALGLPAAAAELLLPVRETLLSLTERLFGGEAPLLKALLWGDKRGLGSDLYAAYRGAGIAHVLALSGLHVSFLALFVTQCSRFLSLRGRLLALAAALSLYAAIAAFPASLVRAAVMSLCCAHATLAERRRDMLSSMAFAALIILCFDPGSLEDAGFLLSFSAVAGIGLMQQPIRERLAFFPSALATAMAVSLSAMLGTLPVTLCLWGELPVLGLFANLLILPIVPPVFLGALLLCLIGLVLPVPAALLAPAVCLLSRSMTAAAAAISALPFSIVTLSKPPALAGAFLFLALIALSRMPQRSFRFRIGAAGCFLLLAAALCL